jgi:hypothetical protein
MRQELRAGKTFGRPRVKIALEKDIQEALRAGDMGMHKIAAKFGVGTGTVQRIVREMRPQARERFNRGDRPYPLDRERVFCSLKVKESFMRCFIHLDTGAQRIEATSVSEFPHRWAAVHAGIEKARDLLVRMSRQSQSIFPEFFVEISGESGQLVALISLRKIVFDEPIADRHRRLCDWIPSVPAAQSRPCHL